MSTNTTGWGHNWGLKLLSLILAFGVWLYVNSKGQVMVNFAIPLEPAGLTKELVLTGIDEQVADVRLSGRESAMARLTTRHIQLALNLTDSQPGTQWVSLAKSDVTLPPGIEVVRVTPRQIKVRVERRETREFKVVADLTGDPAPGMTLTAIQVTPPTVTLTGGDRSFAGLTQIRTQPVDISGLRDDIRREVRLDLRGRDLETVGGENPIRYVTISVAKSPAAPPGDASPTATPAEP